MATKKNEDVCQLHFYVNKATKKALSEKAKHEGITVTGLMSPYFRAVAKGEIELKPERIK